MRLLASVMLRPKFLHHLCINDNKFLIAIIIIVYFLYSFSFKLPLTVFINVHGCLIARLLFFFSLSRSPPLSMSRNTTN